VIDLPTVYVGHIEEFALARDVLTSADSETPAVLRTWSLAVKG
jgi:hypothetical protein